MYMTLYNQKNKPLSLCIPRVDKNTTKAEIHQILEKLEMGIISRIDLVPNKNKLDETKKAFIHFQKWFQNERTLNIYKRLITGENIKVIYSYPWFWKMSLSKTQPL